MKVALTFIHYPVGAGKFLTEAFRDLGHEVMSIGPDTHGFLPWAPGVDFSAYADKPDSEEWPQNYVPDILIQIDAHLPVMGTFPFPNVCYAIDNHVRPYDEVDYDFFFGAHSNGAKGRHPEKFIHLPCAYSPKYHFNTHQERTLDGVMVGVAYPSRQELMVALGKVSKNIQGFTGLLGKEYNDKYNQSKIAIVKSANNDVAMRVFENMAQGCLVLADEVPDFEKLGLKDDVNLVTYRTVPEAVEKFKWLLEHPREQQRIAENGELWLVFHPHTWEARAQTILDTVFGAEKTNAKGPIRQETIRTVEEHPTT